MDKIKENTILLLIYVIISVIVTVTTAYFLYQNQKTVWNEYARNTFTEVLREELQKRNGEDVYFLSWGNADSSTYKDSARNDSLQEVTVIGEYGKKKYLIPTYKLDHNIEDGAVKRLIQGYILGKQSLVADSLNFKWNTILQRKGFSGKNIVRVSVTDALEHETRKYSKDSTFMKTADSLISYYIGYRSEIEVTGFLYLPWWKCFSVTNVVLLCGIWFLSFLFAFFFKQINGFYQSLFVKKLILTVENRILVNATEKSETHIYHLDDGVLFDADLRKLTKGEICKPMAPQSAQLLKGFLDAKDYKLSTLEIDKLLWPKGDGTKNKIYSTIRRLRDDLSNISLCTLDNKNSTYQLKIPHSIEENS